MFLHVSFVEKGVVQNHHVLVDVVVVVGARRTLTKIGAFRVVVVVVSTVEVKLKKMFERTTELLQKRLQKRRVVVVDSTVSEVLRDLAVCNAAQRKLNTSTPKLL